MKKETVDSQRQYILFLEKKIGALLAEINDIRTEIADACVKNENLLGQIDLLEREIDKVETGRGFE